MISANYPGKKLNEKDQKLELAEAIEILQEKERNDKRERLLMEFTKIFGFCPEYHEWEGAELRYAGQRWRFDGVNLSIWAPGGTWRSFTDHEGYLYVTKS